ncbi:MAG: HEPN domain-containing protein [Bacteroidota bacterium]
MGKQEQIQHWVNTSKIDWETAEDLLKLKRFMHSLFFFHLVIEKLLKAHWVKDNLNDIPPFSHNLESIYNQTDLELSTENVDELRALSAWNLEGRYPDYQNKIARQATEKYTLNKYEIVKRIRQCLLEKL